MGTRLHASHRNENDILRLYSLKHTTSILPHEKMLQLQILRLVPILPVKSERMCLTETCTQAESTPERREGDVKG